MSDLLESHSFESATNDDSVFVVSSHSTDFEFVLSARGHLIAGSISALEAQIDQIGCGESRKVILDLTELEEIDRTGLRVLAGMVHYVQASGRKMDIIGASGRVARAIEGADLPQLNVAPPNGHVDQASSRSV